MNFTEFSTMFKDNSLLSYLISKELPGKKPTTHEQKENFTIYEELRSSISSEWNE